MAVNTNIDLVGDTRPVVTPQATAQMAQMVREGTISVLDIMDRVDHRTRAKQELELVTANQGILDATNPDLIQARQSQQLLAGEQAQQTRELLPLARRATEEKLFGDINSGQIQRYGLKEKLAALNELGFAPSPDPQKGITPEFAAEVNKNFASLLQWQKDKADAKFELANIKQGELDTGRGVFQGPIDILTAAPIEQGKVESLRVRAAKTLPEFLRDTPAGGVVAPVAAQPAAPLIQPVQQPVAQVAPVIQPIQAAQPVVIQPSGISGVPPGFTQVKPAPIAPENVKRTDALQRELVQLQAIDDSINQARQLAVPGVVGPGQIGVTRGMHQLLATLPFGLGAGQARTYTSQDTLNTVIANEIGEFVRDWKGAISDKELRFFQAARPRIDSTPERWISYLDEWQTKNEKLKKIVAGELAPDEPAVWAANPKSGATAASGPLPITAPASVPASPSAAPTVSNIAQFNALPSGTVFREPDGTLRKKP